MRLRISLFILLLFTIAGTARAQNESRVGADFRKEGESLKGSCSSFKSILSCAEVLFTDQPVHIAVGSIAPQDGFGAGLAFVEHYTPNDSWRLSWDTDAVASMNGSWRAGVYMKAIFTGSKKETTTTGRPTHPQESTPTEFERPVFNLYAQAISLNKLGFFGLGPSTSVSGRSFFGMREIIVGSEVKWPIETSWPVFRQLHPSLYGEANGRFVAIRASDGQASPSIEQVYNEASAPGLTSQPGFVQFGEGIRLQPGYGDHVKLNYFVLFQQFVAPGDSAFSFRRFTADLSHEFPIYRKTRTIQPKSYNGPDDCSKDVDNHACPGISLDREGTIAVRLLISESIAPAGHVVPFYFQPTLGGSDIMGNPSLSSYQDYRFRAPNVFLLQASFEHSIYGPMGFTCSLDEGKVALERGDINFAHLAHSYSAGLTLRAGGFPQVYLLFSWGGHEGDHTVAQMNTSLLGGAARPSLF
ncbi:MAG: hypothetical protein ABSF92_06750 [Candidatus Acidiferrales bacterium]